MSGQRSLLLVGIILAILLSSCCIIIDCLTYGGLFKDEWWQRLRVLWQ